MVNQSQSPKKRNVDGLTRRQSSRNGAFFSELDQLKNRFSGFWSVVILILIVVFAGLIIAAVKFKRTNISFEDGSIGNSNLSFSDRLSSISSFGPATIIYSAEEFVAASGAGSDSFPLKDSKFTFSKDLIVLTGKIRDSWIPVSVKLKITAVVTGDKFSFLVAANELENIVVYGENKDQIENTFDQNINQVLKDKNMIAKSVSVSDDRIELQVIKGLK